MSNSINTNFTTIHSLPGEMLGNIFNFCSESSFVVLRQVCSQWKAIFEQKAALTLASRDTPAIIGKDLPIDFTISQKCVAILKRCIELKQMVFDNLKPEEVTKFHQWGFTYRLNEQNGDKEIVDLFRSGPDGMRLICSKVDSFQTLRELKKTHDYYDNEQLLPNKDNTNKDS